MYSVLLCLNLFMRLTMAALFTSTASSTALSKSRGAFILFEGGDRCGKSTQAALLNSFLEEKFKITTEHSSALIKFPDRTSSIGHLINSYLQSTSNLNDQAIHLLFSANRWESSNNLLADLNGGKTLVSNSN